MELSRIRNAAVSRKSVTMKEQSRAVGSNNSHLDDHVSIVPARIWWEMCPTATRPAAASD